MTKKIKGNYFIFSANNLKDGRVVYLSVNDLWVKDPKNALIFTKENLKYFENKVSLHEKNCLVVGPYIVETNKDGSIIKRRERIRAEGLNIGNKQYV